MSKLGAKTGMHAAADVVRGAGVENIVKIRNVYRFECRGPDGRLKWVDEVHNIVVNEGLNDQQAVYFLNGTQDSTWFCGLTDGTPTVAPTDTLASHPGWVEVTAYAGTRQGLTLASTGIGQLDNSAAKASFAINANGTTVGGAFVTGVTSGTAGILYGAGAFSGGDKTVDDGDTLNVTVTLSLATA